MAVSQFKILLITVHYKTSEGIFALLESLHRLEGFSSAEVIIVDNASGDKEVSQLKAVVRRFPNVRLIESHANCGYFGAARLAFDRCVTDGHGLPDWTIVCNHDVVIDDAHFFLRLVAQDSSAIGVIAPRIRIKESGVDQNPFMRHRPGRLRWWTYRFAKSSYWVAVLWEWMSRVKKLSKSRVSARPEARDTSPPAKSELIYAAHGSFFIFSRRYFEAGGYLDGELFLYGEEISVAEICRSLTLPIVYEPALRVLHDEHQSTGRVISRTSYRRERDALRYVSSRYLGQASCNELEIQGRHSIRAVESPRR